MNEGPIKSRSSAAMINDTAQWIDPIQFPPPLGVKVQALSWWGVATYTNWSKDAHVSFVAWAPLPKIDPWLKERLESGRPKGKQ